MSFPCPISVSWNISYGVAAHDYMGAATQGAKVMGLAAEVFATHMWTAGYLLGQNKLTESVVYVGGAGFVLLDGHDTGAMCIHIQMVPAPDNVLTCVHIPFSGRKSCFSASTVKMNKKPTAALLDYLFPPSLLLCGDPVSMPTPFNSGGNLMHSVTVGVTPADILAGYFRVLAEVAIDLILFGLSGPSSSLRSAGAASAGAEAAWNSAGASVAQITRGQVVDALVEKVGSVFAKQTLAKMAGASAFGWAANMTNWIASGGEGPAPVPEVSFGVGGPYGLAVGTTQEGVQAQTPVGTYSVNSGGLSNRRSFEATPLGDLIVQATSLGGDDS
ncbi:MAG: hypothetical protein AAGF12_02935 [Myxococcota bacterium]